MAITKKKLAAISKPLKRTSALAPATSSDLWQALDDTFARFRSDFEDILFPANSVDSFSFMSETRVPVVDWKIEKKIYFLRRKCLVQKEDIEIEVQDNFVAITGEVEWKYDKKEHEYLCKERACKSFNRIIDLPEAIKADEVIEAGYEYVCAMENVKLFRKRK